MLLTMFAIWEEDGYCWEDWEGPMLFALSKTESSSIDDDYFCNVAFDSPFLPSEV